ncbi:MAG: hypothetical protein C0179_01675 [Fervidicoccus sp.]|nr:MAG: hypothetical protein C0179_01675 [Fervidicoccus sp.]
MASESSWKGLSLRGLLVLFTASKLALLLISVMFSNFSIQEAMTMWDAKHYIDIATRGYSSPDEYAFSPLFPLLIRLFNHFIGIPWLSAAIISNAFSYLAIILVARLYGTEAACILAFFPTFLAYTLFPYSEALSLTFIALSLLFSQKGKNTITSMISFSLAILTSYSTAIALPSFLLLRRKKLILIPIAVGIAIFAFFYVETGDPLYYFYVEGKYWGSDIAMPWGQAIWILHGWFTSQPWGLGSIRLPPAYWLIRNIIFEVFFLVSLFPLAKKKMRMEMVFSLLIIFQILFITGVPAISIPRLIIRALPAFYGASVLLKKHLRIYCFTGFITSIFVVIAHVLSFFA